MRESEIERYLVQRARTLGGVAYKFVSPGRVGVPDRIVVMPDRLMFVELKAPGKKPEPHQLREHQRLRSMGQSVYVVDSIAAVDELLP